VADAARTVSGGYIGDLLSRVMGKAAQHSAWMTIMTNVNVAAVALLADVACIVLVEGVTPDPQLIDKVSVQGINLYKTDKDAFSLACEAGALLG